MRLKTNQWRRINILSLALLGLTLTLSSCKKEGCTDPEADNYNSEAKKDDGSCTYTDPCENSTFNLFKLGVVETNAPLNRVSLLFQILDGKDKGVVGMTDKSKYSLIDYNQEMTTNSEAGVQIESYGTIPTEIYTAIVIDISKSVEGLVGDIKEAAKAFVDQSMSEQKIAIYTFDGNAPVRVQNYTNNKNILKSAINTIPETNLGTSTNLYETLIHVESEMPGEVYNTSQIRQSNFLVFTDGRETANPTPAMLTQVEYAIEGRTVFVAALQSSDLDAGTLKNNIASNSSNYFLAEDINEVKTKFKDIQTDIEKLSKSVYWLFYTSPRKGNNYWDIELKIKGNCNDSYNATLIGSYNSSGF